MAKLYTFLILLDCVRSPIKGGVLWGLPHVMTTQSPPAYGGVSSLLQLPHGSQLLASAGSSSSLTQSRLVLFHVLSLRQ